MFVMWMDSLGIMLKYGKWRFGVVPHDLKCYSQQSLPINFQYPLFVQKDNTTFPVKLMIWLSQLNTDRKWGLGHTSDSVCVWVCVVYPILWGQNVPTKMAIFEILVFVGEFFGPNEENRFYIPLRDVFIKVGLELGDRYSLKIMSMKIPHKTWNTRGQCVTQNPLWFAVGISFCWPMDIASLI